MWSPLPAMVCSRSSEQIAQCSLHRVKHALACQGFGAQIDDTGWCSLSFAIHKLDKRGF